ncbi:hypothetical protein [Methanobacterium sp. ACI-7]|uniref:hypothetical protein n=1 Tax=unclassified Methanobacterium TaxID=2627676 RepID=UPI0039C04BC1
MFEMESSLFKSHRTSIIFAWSLRIFLISFGIYEIITGFPVYGLMILIAVAFILLPSILTKKHIFIPLELEILFLLIVTLEYVVANSLHFYALFEYYDKFQHTLIPTISSFIGMLLVYIGYRFNKFKASYILSWGIIVLITIGLGTIIEVSEYAYDQFIGPATNFYISQGVLTQGSPILDPFTDTMTDLILDIIGALIGATFGLWLLIRHEKQGGPSLLDEEIDLFTNSNKEDKN